jgi:hypothetical protein
MLDFDKYVARHGEFGVQAIIERLERYEGIRGQVGHCLETRWVALMQASAQPQTQTQNQAMDHTMDRTMAMAA